MGQKVVLIIGCGSGIGEALAESFFDCGCRVIATSRCKGKLSELAEAEITCLPLDVNDSSNIQHVIDEVLRLEGRIDVLVNNAGFGLMGPMMDIGQATCRTGDAPERGRIDHQHRQHFRAGADAVRGRLLRIEGGTARHFRCGPDGA